MKELIAKALLEAFILLNKQEYTKKRECTSICVSTISPFELVDFLLENEIPKDCWFTVDENQIDVCVTYNIMVNATDTDILKRKRNRFQSIAFRYVYTTLIENGYKRVGFNTGLLKEFDDTTVYDMYMNNDWNRLEKYYSLYFKKI